MIQTRLIGETRVPTIICGQLPREVAAGDHMRATSEMGGSAVGLSIIYIFKAAVKIFHEYLMLANEIKNETGRRVGKVIIIIITIIRIVILGVMKKGFGTYRRLDEKR